MFDIEVFLKERLNPLHRLWYTLWVLWWPLWRTLYSGPRIGRAWQQHGLIREGQTLLDYGCGTGYFSLLSAQMVGTNGLVYALDCFPRQLQIVEQRARKRQLNNIRTLFSDGKAPLPDESVDIVWMCDVLHEVKERRALLEDIYRVLKTEGTLAIHDGMKDRVLEYTDGLFMLAGAEGKFYKLNKIKAE